jgi:hypothetical protein
MEASGTGKCHHLEDNMKRYADRSGNSGVEAYRTTDTSIFVKFRNRDAPYEYRSTGRAGPEKVRRMKVLAAAGEGLSTYISQHAHDDYER